MLQDIPSSSKDEWVIQRYLKSPSLYNNKKFHFRCYALMTGDITGYIYDHAFILTASLDYNTTDSTDSDSSSCSVLEYTKHITNLSVNKGTADHPGQIPCNLPIEYPEVVCGGMFFGNYALIQLCICLFMYMYPIYMCICILQVYEQVKRIWASVVAASSTYMVTATISIISLSYIHSCA